MSDEEVLARYTERFGERASRLEPADEKTAVDDLGCFGWLRGLHERAAMLQLRRKDGNILAVGYGWLERVQFDASLGIALYLGKERILIRGLNLNREVRPGVRLFEGIARHVVPWIREASRDEGIAGQAGVCLVEAIEW